MVSQYFATAPAGEVTKSNLDRSTALSATDCTSIMHKGSLSLSLSLPRRLSSWLGLLNVRTIGHSVSFFVVDTVSIFSSVKSDVIITG